MVGPRGSGVGREGPRSSEGTLFLRYQKTQPA